MTPLISLVLFVVISYMISKLSASLRPQSLWLKSILYNGFFYLMIGYLIGPGGLNYINEEILHKLDVIQAFVLTWAGFVVGMQIKMARLARFPQSYFFSAILNYILSIVLLIAVLYLVFVSLYQVPGWNDFLMLAVIGATASPILIGIVSQSKVVKGPPTYYLQFLSALVNVIGIIFVGVLIYFQQNISFIEKPVSGFWLIGLVIIVSACSAYFFKYLYNHMTKEEENSLFLLGFLIFLAGLALYLKQSLLLSGFIFGVVLANILRDNRKLISTIIELEKPFYLLLLLLMGTTISFQSFAIILIIILYIFLTIMVNLLSGYISIYNYNSHFRTHFNKSVGIANVGIGGIALALALEYHIQGISSNSSMIILIVSGALLFTDFIALNYLSRTLVRSAK